MTEQPHEQMMSLATEAQIQKLDTKIDELNKKMDHIIDLFKSVKTHGYGNNGMNNLSFNHVNLPLKTLEDIKELDVLLMNHEEKRNEFVSLYKNFCVKS